MRMTIGGIALLATMTLAACDNLPGAASANAPPIVGRWACTGGADGMNYESTFDYRADGRYISTQHISQGPDNFIEGGGGGTWQLDGDTLTDTKTEGRLDRFVRNGVEVPASDPEYQQIAAGTQANLGSVTQGQVTITGDLMVVGFYTCQRQP